MPRPRSGVLCPLTFCKKMLRTCILLLAIPIIGCGPELHTHDGSAPLCHKRCSLHGHKMQRVRAKIEDGHTYTNLAKAADNEFPNTGRLYGVDNSMNSVPREGWICPTCKSLELEWVREHGKGRWDAPSHMKAQAEHAVSGNRR